MGLERCGLSSDSLTVTRIMIPSAGARRRSQIMFKLSLPPVDSEPARTRIAASHLRDRGPAAPAEPRLLPGSA